MGINYVTKSNGLRSQFQKVSLLLLSKKLNYVEMWKDPNYFCHIMLIFNLWITRMPCLV